MLRQSITYQHSDLPEVVPNRHGYAPEVLAPSDPEVVPSDHPQATYSSFTTDKHFVEHSSAIEYDDHDETHQISPNGHAEKQILGLRRRTFIIAAVIVALLAVGLSVGLAIGLSSRTAGASEGDANSSPNPKSNDSSGIQTNLLAQTSIASANYSTSKGIQNLYVFFQDQNNDLLTSVWDTKSRSWSTKSISQNLNDNDTSLELLPATPISAFCYLNPDFQIRVYAMTTDHAIVELLTFDTSLATGWQLGRLGAESTIIVGAGSKMAALRPTCGTGQGCREHFPQLAVAYQDEFGVLNVAKAPQWESQDVGSAANGTGVGLSSMVGETIDNVKWRLHFADPAGTLLEYSSEEDISTWNQSGTLGTVEQPMGANLANFSYDLVNIMIIDVKSDGSLAVRTFDSNWVVNQTPSFTGAPETLSAGLNFTAITGNPQKRIYSVVDGEIHEWDFEGRRPLHWTYMGTVPTEL